MCSVILKRRKVMKCVKWDCKYYYQPLYRNTEDECDCKMNAMGVIGSNTCELGGVIMDKAKHYKEQLDAYEEEINIIQKEFHKISKNQ